MPVSSDSILVTTLLMHYPCLDSGERGPDSDSRSEEEAAKHSAMSALNAQIEKTKAVLEVKLQERDEYSAEFIRFQVCLSILLNNNFMSLVVKGNTVTKAFLDDYKVSPERLDADDMKSVLEQFQELVEHHTALPNDLPSTIIGLSSVLHTSRDYFDKEESTIEASIDAYLSQHVDLGTDITESPADFRILLGFLDSL